jgi:hypothetical protein
MGRSGTAFIAGALIGGVAGTAATLWRAPQSGRMTRAQLGDQIIAHAGPAGAVLSAAADGLNAAGVRVVQAVNIATRFVEELVHPSTPVLVAAPVVSRTVVVAAEPRPEVTFEPAGVDVDGTPTTANPGSSFRPAAMNITPILDGRR